MKSLSIKKYLLCLSLCGASLLLSTPVSAQLAGCGNNVLASSPLGVEDCDDGNTAAGDGCDEFCAIEPGYERANILTGAVRLKCGDAIVLAGEQCDDGNNQSGDGCSSSCQIENGWTCNVPARPDVVNGSFEEPIVPANETYRFYSSVANENRPWTGPGWTLDLNSFDIYHQRQGWLINRGDQAVDLNGNSRGRLSQVLAVEAGRRYVLAFQLSNNAEGGGNRKTVEVNIYDHPSTTPIETETFETTREQDRGGNGPATSNGFTYRTVTFTATSSQVRIVFQSVHFGSGGVSEVWGPAIDDVKIAGAASFCAIRSTCENDGQCNDNNDCTTDACANTGNGRECTNTPLPDGNACSFMNGAGVCKASGNSSLCVECISNAQCGSAMCNLATNRCDRDSDGDGKLDSVDLDDDNDGIPDLIEGDDDVDGDNIPNSLDLDTDGDTLYDAPEGGGIDANNDGRLDGFTDTNGNGLADSVEASLGGTALPLPDTDGDSKQDYKDADDDNDGLETRLEVMDSTTLGNNDVNGNGKPNWLDTDADGDGKGDREEGRGDSDGDGIPNYLDPIDGANSSDDFTGTLAGSGFCSFSAKQSSWFHLFAYAAGFALVLAAKRKKKNAA